MTDESRATMIVSERRFITRCRTGGCGVGGDGKRSRRLTGGRQRGLALLISMCGNGAEWKRHSGTEYAYHALRCGEWCVVEGRFSLRLKNHQNSSLHSIQ